MNITQKRRIVINYTCKQLEQYGIKQMHMDEVACGLNISKRTIYKLFRNKNSLIMSCLRKYRLNGRNLLLLDSCQMKYSWQRSFQVMNAYITMLQQFDPLFLNEINSDIAYSPVMQKEKHYWEQQFADSLKECSFSLIFDTSIKQIASNILDLCYQNHLNKKPYFLQLQLGYLLLKGLTSSKSSPELDEQIRQEWERLNTILQSWKEAYLTGSCIYNKIRIR